MWWGKRPRSMMEYSLKNINSWRVYKTFGYLNEQLKSITEGKCSYIVLQRLMWNYSLSGLACWMVGLVCTQMYSLLDQGYTAFSPVLQGEETTEATEHLEMIRSQRETNFPFKTMDYILAPVVSFFFLVFLMSVLLWCLERGKQKIVTENYRLG